MSKRALTPEQLAACLQQYEACSSSLECVSSDGVLAARVRFQECLMRFEGTGAWYEVGDEFDSDQNKSLGAEFAAAIKKYIAEMWYVFGMCYLHNCLNTDLLPLPQQEMRAIRKLALEHARGLRELAGDAKAVYILIIAAQHNDPDVLCALARCYRYGWGVEKDVAKALECYVKAADYGSYEAVEQVAVGQNALLCYNYAKQICQHFKQAAENGDTNACFNLAYCYCNAFGTERNYNSAVRTLENAANRGCANALVYLGILYYAGFGVDYNAKRAVELYEEAARIGSRIGQAWLAWCHINGVGTDRNVRLGVDLYQQAAARGESGAAFYLGYYHKWGAIAEKNQVKAFQYFRQAAIAGHSDGQFHAGFCYYQGVSGRYNLAKAIYWYYRAVSYENVAAADALGRLRVHPGFYEAYTHCYEIAQCFYGLNKAHYHLPVYNLNAEIALVCFEESAANGCACAHARIADCHFWGCGVAKDMAAAARSYTIAGLLDVQDMLNLAYCYAGGECEHKSELDAFALLKQANSAIRAQINAICAYTY